MKSARTPFSFADFVFAKTFFSSKSESKFANPDSESVNKIRVRPEPGMNSEWNSDFWVAESHYSLLYMGLIFNQGRGNILHTRFIFAVADVFYSILQYWSEGFDVHSYI